MEILKRCEVDDFLAVNVLEDADVRQGIKTYASWPTIPQLYVRGEFVGGARTLCVSCIRAANLRGCWRGGTLHQPRRPPRQAVDVQAGIAGFLRQRFGGGGVAPDAGLRRFVGGWHLRKEGADYSGEDVAAASPRQCGVAGGAEGVFRRRAVDDGAGAFEYRHDGQGFG